MSFVYKEDAKSSKGKSVKPMELGSMCGDPCGVCDPGLVCNDRSVSDKPNGEWCPPCLKKEDCLRGLIYKEREFAVGKCACLMGFG